MSIAHGLDDNAIYRGQAKRFTGTFTTATDITGWTIVQRFRLSRGGSALVTLSPTVTDAVNGVMTSQLTAAQTALFTEPKVYCEYWRTDSSNETPLAYLTIMVYPTISS